ncbi:hypothetical protein [Microbacterium sp. ZW T5_56]|uniref:hypothetical protein n=1 Tax=Microbacterium sp. ZW T5_56 TaxID=3378081 RepID=UPI0038520733
MIPSDVHHRGSVAGDCRLLRHTGHTNIAAATTTATGEDSSNYSSPHINRERHDPVG